jgi:hypothetical protein
VKQPELITRSAGSYVESPLGGIVRESPDSFVRGSDQAQKNHIPLVALESISVAAYYLSLFDFISVQTVLKHSLNQACLVFALQRDHTHRFTGIQRILAALANGIDESLSFRPITGGLGTSFPKALTYVTHLDGFESLWWILAQW